VVVVVDGDADSFTLEHEHDNSPGRQILIEPYDLSRSRKLRLVESPAIDARSKVTQAHSGATRYLKSNLTVSDLLPLGFSVPM